MARMQSKRWLNFFLLTIPTMGIFWLSLWLTIHVRYPQGLAPEQEILNKQMFGILGIVWLCLFYGFGLLNIETHRRVKNLLSALIGATTLSFLVSVVFFYAQPSLSLTPRRVLLIDLLSVFLLSFFWQWTIRLIAKKSSKKTLYLLNLENELGSQKEEMIKKIEQEYLVREISDHHFSELLQKKIDASSLFVVPSQSIFSPELLESFTTLHSQGIRFVRLTDFYEDVFRCVHPNTLTQWWLIENVHPETFNLYSVAKRFGDLLLCIPVATVFFITFPVIALLMKVTDRGPLFFTQTRVSLGGKPFTLIKYRTMRTNTATNTWTTDRDPRITTLGRIMRKTRLDELPQWVNILKGEMSFIGPRPEQSHIVETLKSDIPFFESRHAVRPGLIGWAQLHVYAGTTEESKRKLQYDLYYLKHRSFLFDLEIFLKTIAHVFFLNGK